MAKRLPSLVPPDFGAKFGARGHPVFLGQSPTRLKDPTIAIDPRLRHTLTRLRTEAITPAAINLVDRISKLERRFKKVLRLGNPNLTRELGECLVESFSITTSDGALPFRTVLKNAGLSPHEWFNNQCIMQIDKLAAYHRIPKTLAKEVHRKGTRRLFSNIKVEYVDAYKSVRSSLSLNGNKVHCHVHAEVQLIIYYLRSTTAGPPRFIGTSKAACFLCHLLIVEHGGFAVSTWHGRLYDQWTIPDLAEYSAEHITILRAIIHRMHAKCLQLLAATHPRRRFPLTSRHNLQEFPKFSPTSTVLSAKQAARASPRQANEPAVEAASDIPNQKSHSALLINFSTDLGSAPVPTKGLASPGPPSSQELSNTVVESHATLGSGTGDQISSSEWDEWWESNSTASIPSTSSTRLVQLAPNGPHFIDLPDLEIVAEIQPPSVGTMTLKRRYAPNEIPTSHVVQLDELQAGHELTLERGENEACVVLWLRKGNRNLCCVELKWS